MAARTSSVEHLQRAVEALRAMGDPMELAVESTEFMRAMKEAHEQVRDLRREAVLELNDPDSYNMGYAKIADLLGITKARAQQLVSGWQSERRPGVIEVDTRVAVAELEALGWSREEIAAEMIPRIRAYRGADKLTLQQYTKMLGVPQRVVRPLLAEHNAWLREQARLEAEGEE